jgi:hypothetical protein
MLSCSAPFAASVRNNVAEVIDVPEHLVEAFRRALELSPITLPVKDAHRVFDGIEVVEELRDRLTQLRCFSSSRGGCKHLENLGTKAVLFKAKATCHARGELTARVQRLAEYGPRCSV